MEEIDKIKGTTPPNFPKSWRCWRKIEPTDTDEERKEKYIYNSMVVKKKPYFFIYLYSNLMKEYKNYEKNFNSLSMKKFGQPIKELLKKEKHNDNELDLIRKYRKYSPVLETECIMNILCKNIESIDFDIKYKPNSKSLLPNYIGNTKIEEKKLVKLFEIYREYKSQKKYKGISIIIDNEGIQDDDINEILHNAIFYHKDGCKNKMYNLFSSSRELFDHLIEMCTKYCLKYDFIWDILGEDIIDIIPQGNTLIIIDDNSGVDYLGKTYSLKEMSIN